MKKKLLALAVAGAFVVPVAVADTANVTIYGVADASFDSVDNGSTNTPSATAIAAGCVANTNCPGARSSRISSNTSLFGFKGDEDLGGGLKAVWQIESEIDLDGTGPNGAAPTSGFATRNSFAGLKSDSWGSLILGRHDTPYKTSDRRLDLFGNHIADNRALMGGGAGRGSGDTKGFDKRATETVVYNSPVINGLKVLVAYVAGAETITTATQTKGNIWSLAGTYDVAPFYGVLAYQGNDYGSVNTGTVVQNTNGASANTSERAWKLGGGYKADQFAVNAIYEKTDDNFGGGAAAGTASSSACTGAAAGGSCYGHRAFYMAGQYNITPDDAVKLAYTRVGNLQDGNLADTGARHVSVGYDHKMSKRTNLYATYTKLNNDRLAQYELKGEGAATGNVFTNGAGAGPSAFSLGMMHTF